MIKWGLSGFLAGALASAILLWALQQRRAAADGEAAQAAAAAREAVASTERDAAAKAASALRVERDRAIDEAAGLKKKIYELESRPSAAGNGGGPAGERPGKPTRRSWKDIAADFGRLGGKLRGLPMDSWPPEADALKKDMQEALAALAAELRMSVDQVLASPRGLEALMLEMLAQTVPPLSAAEEARLRELLATQQEAWDKFAASAADLSRLEQTRGFVDLAITSREEFFSALTPGQAEFLKAFPALNQDLQGSQTWLDGSRAKVTATMTDQWSASLGLNEIQKAALGPLVTEYIDKERALNEEIWGKRRAGEELSRQADYSMRLGLMIETQKKISDTLSLTPDQQKALRDWQFTWGVNVTDEMGK